MSKKAYKIISVIACVIALIGLITFTAGIRPVNIGVFVFPAAISAGAFIAYRKK